MSESYISITVFINWGKLLRVLMYLELHRGAQHLQSLHYIRKLLLEKKLTINGVGFFICGLLTLKSDNREGNDVPTSFTRFALRIIFM